MTEQLHWTQWSETKLHELANWLYSLITTPEGFTSQLEPFDGTCSSFFHDSFYIKLRRPRNLEDLSDEGKAGILLLVTFESAVYLYGLVLIAPNTVQAVVDANIQAAIDRVTPVPPGAFYHEYRFDPRIMEDANE